MYSYNYHDTYVNYNIKKTRSIYNKLKRLRGTTSRLRMIRDSSRYPAARAEAWSAVLAVTWLSAPPISRQQALTTELAKKKTYIWQKKVAVSLSAELCDENRACTNVMTRFWIRRDIYLPNKWMSATYYLDITIKVEVMKTIETDRVDLAVCCVCTQRGASNQNVNGKNTHSITQYLLLHFLNPWGSPPEL